MAYNALSRLYFEIDHSASTAANVQDHRAVRRLLGTDPDRQGDRRGRRAREQVGAWWIGLAGFPYIRYRGEM